MIAEYRDEIMIIKKRIKIVFDKTGKALWASNIKKDKKEENNMLENRDLEENEKKIIKKIKPSAVALCIELSQKEDNCNWELEIVSGNQFNAYASGKNKISFYNSSKTSSFYFLKYFSSF